MASNSQQIPYCTAPWHCISLSPNGSMGPCCMIPYGLGDITKGDTLQSAWEGPALKKFRQNMLDNKLPSGCLECQHRESVGIKSVKSFFDDIANDWRTSTTPYTSEGSLDEFYHLDISLSNKCNLKCRFCYSGNSTAWFRDRDSILKEHKHDPKKYDIYEETLGMTTEVIDVPPEDILPFMASLKNLKQIELKGGEPFMSKGHLPLLRALVQSGQAKNLSVLYTSNGTMIDDEVLELWREFHKISFAVSADGLGEVYKYVRGGSYSFENNVLPQLARLDKLNLSNIDLHFHYTICAYNLLELGHFLKWFTETTLRCTLTFGLVDNPKYLSPRLLPKEIIDESIRRISQYDAPGVKELVSGLKNLNLENTSQLREYFFEYTQSLDRLRKQTLAQAIPELKPFYESLRSTYKTSELSL